MSKMTDNSASFNFNYLLLAGLGLVSIAVFIIDLRFPLGVAGGIPYALLIMATYWSRRKRHTVGAGILSTLLIVAGYSFSQPSGYLVMAVANRLMAIIVIWGTVWFVINYKRSLNRIKKSEDRMSALFEAATEGIIISDLNGRIVMANQKIEELFGYPREELVGEKIEVLIPNRYQPKHKRFRLDYYDDPEPRPMGQGRDLYGLHKDGEEFPVEVSLNHFENEEGRFVISYVIDITQRKKAEHKLLKAHRELKQKAVELKHSNEELEQFAYVASHDLQEPLRMVASYTQLLARRYKDQLDEDASDFINYAVNGAQRMQELLNDLLQFSRVGSRAKRFKKVSSEAVIENVLQNLERYIEENDANIVTESPLPELSADKLQLVQLFQNLIQNAIKFKKEGKPEVRIKASELEDYWQFSVADNGMGIDENYQKRIFVIFQRLHQREAYSGSGIGLAICKKIVERHGGEIWVDSEPGRGATFHFTIAKNLESAQEEKRKEAIKNQIFS
ncbi:sensor histidine kinase [Fodinibius sediminis]|uniref:histidine kinase n=1 Tax=Fodinibius sediminis TaxID=1214077 RepID=A0A521CZ82_9BACT|nr:ATP-binding protein [Fodinibius sediminis]SMO64757.1 PAS domain S-box-containing protein [Fodinibius sediminis]